MVNETQLNKAVEVIKANESPPTWIGEARKKAKELKALVTGENFCEELIENIEKIESKSRAEARKKYSKDIRDMFFRVYKNRQNVFEAVGGSEIIDVKDKTIRLDIESYINNFKGHKSVEQYLSDYFFHLWDTEPNGLIFIEYISTPQLKIYPTFKSINDIRNYSSNGQKLDYVLFEPILDKNEGFKLWRYVDSDIDVTVKETNGLYTQIEEKSFVNEFKTVPAVIISNVQKIGCEQRISPIEQVSELAKDYARDKSILTIYKFFNGFPIHWRYVQQCRTCHGTGKKDNSSCKSCDGKGTIGKSDVTDMVQITAPREGDPVLTPNIAGYVAPDLGTWKQYKEDLKTNEELIYHTAWGTLPSDKTNETATGRFIDTQPITNELGMYSANVEYVHNELVKFVISIIPKASKVIYYKSYGRRFIIESADTIIKKYDESREAGAPTLVLDRLLNEFIIAKYKTDTLMMNIMLKKAKLEPYIHYDIVTVNTLFGAGEALKKVMFHDFWETADASLSYEELSKQLNLYYENNRANFTSGQIPIA